MGEGDGGGWKLTCQQHCGHSYGPEVFGALPQPRTELPGAGEHTGAVAAAPVWAKGIEDFLELWSWAGFPHEDLHRGSGRDTQRPAPTKGLAGCSTHAPWVLGTTGQIGIYHPHWKLLYPLPSNLPILLQIERIRRKGTFETQRVVHRVLRKPPASSRLAAVRAAGSRASTDLSPVVPLIS